MAEYARIKRAFAAAERARQDPSASSDGPDNGRAAVIGEASTEYLRKSTSNAPGEAMVDPNTQSSKSPWQREQNGNASSKHHLLMTTRAKPPSNSKTTVSDHLRSQEAVVFKTQHLLYSLFFLWLTFIQASGIYFFTKGFLLTRLVLEQRSSCIDPPLSLANHGQCWMPQRIDRAVVIIIDALRYDFTVPRPHSSHHYHNALTSLYDTAVQRPAHAFLRPFIADPPTATLQRLKGLTTGTLPTFVDVGSNFAGTAIDEDNLIAQLADANRTLVHLGDDTWQALFPEQFNTNLSRPYDSFNVWDLHTVDNGVTEHLMPLLNEGHPPWDVVIGHYLGVDHAGHRYGPDHPAMRAKLQQMDEILQRIMAALDDTTLLVVLGDHGMDAKGDHGGESDDEVQAALWMFAKQPLFGRTGAEAQLPPENATIRPVPQIDLVPTLALMLGIPVPFNNLGAPIPEAFLGAESSQWDRLANAEAVTAAQIHRYQLAYMQARGLDDRAMSGPSTQWQRALDQWHILETTPPKNDAAAFQNAATAFSAYQQENLRVCRDLWARFDISSMIIGVSILAVGLVMLVIFASSISVPAFDRSQALIARLLRRIGVSAGAGAAASFVTPFLLPEASTLDTVLGMITVSSLIGCASVFVQLPSISSRFLPSSIWHFMSAFFILSQSAGFASNSYTIWEDEILLFFLATFGVVAFVTSNRQAAQTDRVLGMYHAGLWLILGRLAALSRLCREEQMPFCRSTFYASATSSTSAIWQLLIPFVVAVMLPGVIRSYYAGTRSFEGSAVVWVDIAFRAGLFGAASYWILDAADDGGWWPSFEGDRLKNIRVMLAQVVLSIAFAAGIATFVWAGPCVRIESSGSLADGEGRSNDTSPFDPASSTPGSAPSREKTPARIIILGYANVHGSRYALLVTALLLGTLAVQKPMGLGALALASWQLFSLMEILETNGLTLTPLNPIGPTMLGVLGSFAFFKTGHQTTLSSIQWDAAFIALKTLRYPWSPLLVVLNTFAGPIVAATAVPLLVLWKRPLKQPGILRDVARALALYVLYYATINLATTMWAGHLRRHLMLFRIFSPRFMTGAVLLLVVDLVVLFVALAGVRWNTLGVAEVFGWS